MKHLILTPFIIVFFMVGAYAQPQIKYFEKDSGRLEIAYFPNGKVSTRKLTPKGSYSRIQGYAKAFDTKGKLIFNEVISSMGGHGGVRFQYHTNGAIKSANVTFQPDGGIQRHDITYFFNEQGVRTGEQDNSYPFKPILEEPGVKPSAPKPAPSTPAKTELKTETMECAVIVQMRAYIENTTDITVRVDVIPNNPDSKKQTITIQPGERIFCADYISAQIAVAPTSYYRFEIPLDLQKKVKMGEWKMHKKSDQLSYCIMDLLPR